MTKDFTNLTDLEKSELVERAYTIAFARQNDSFVERNAHLLGISLDINSSHLAWVYNIYQNTGIEIPFPIVSDKDMSISKMYGMIAPNISTNTTVRNVFIIDDKQIIRAILVYPLLMVDIYLKY